MTQKNMYVICGRKYRTSLAFILYSFFYVTLHLLQQIVLFLHQTEEFDNTFTRAMREQVSKTESFSIAQN